jgi:hypothetical protein
MRTMRTRATTEKLFDGPPRDHVAGEAVLPLLYGLEWSRAFHRFLSETPSLAPLHTLFGGDASLELSPGDLVRVHAKAIGFLHRTLDPALRANFAMVIAAFVKANADAWTPRSEEAAQPDSDTVTRLNERGYAALDPVPSAHVQALLTRMEEVGYVAAPDVLKNERERPARSAEALRGEMNLAHVRATDVLRLPGLIDLACDPALLEILSAHLGAPPILIDASAWRSFAGADGPKTARDAQLFHFDLDSYRFAKVFLYLTDVDTDSGPHILVPTTHRPDVLAGLAGARGTPERAAFEDWYFGATRKDEEDVKRWIGIDPVEITGDSGARFVVNTEAIHRGKPPAARDRGVLQLVYGIAPSTAWSTPFEPVRPIDRDGRPIGRLSGSAAYAMRLFFPNLIRGL